MQQTLLPQCLEPWRRAVECLIIGTVVLGFSKGGAQNAYPRVTVPIGGIWVLHCCLLTIAGCCLPNGKMRRGGFSAQLLVMVSWGLRFHCLRGSPKSKSGPLGPPGIPNYLLDSPAGQTLQGASVGNLMARSAFSAGVIAPDGFSDRSSVSSAGGGNFPNRIDPCMARSVSFHGYFELPIKSLLPAPQGKCSLFCIFALIWSNCLG